MNQLTCQIAEKNLKHQHKCLYANMIQCKTHKDGVHITHEHPKPYIWNTNHKCKYQNNL